MRLRLDRHAAGGAANVLWRFDEQMAIKWMGRSWQHMQEAWRLHGWIIGEWVAESQSVGTGESTSSSRRRFSPFLATSAWHRGQPHQQHIPLTRSISVYHLSARPQSAATCSLSRLLSSLSHQCLSRANRRRPCRTRCTASIARSPHPSPTFAAAASSLI
jgi:hypothetical protein